MIFLGTPEFSIPSLELLKNRVDLVITQPDKPAGRKKILTPSPVKEYALAQGIPVSHDLDIIQKTQPDLCVVVAYGKIIPQEILNICPFINLHPSLLPKYRGPSPIQYALLNGDVKTGVTVMQIDAGMDTGPILAQEETLISLKDNYLTLSKKLATQGAQLLTRALKENPKPQPQIIDKTTVTKLIKREHGQVDLKKDSPQEIINKLRAFTPWPGIFTFYKNKRLKILKAHWQNGQLIIDLVQLEGKKSIPYLEFIKGHPDF